MRFCPSRLQRRARPLIRRRSSKRCRNNLSSRRNKKCRCCRSSSKRVQNSRQSRTILPFPECRRCDNFGPFTTKARRSCRKFLAPRSTNSCRPSANRISRRRLRKSAPEANPGLHTPALPRREEQENSTAAFAHWLRRAKGANRENRDRNDKTSVASVPSCSIRKTREQADENHFSTG